MLRTAIVCTLVLTGAPAASQTPSKAPSKPPPVTREWLIGTWKGFPAALPNNIPAAGRYDYHTYTAGGWWCLEQASGVNPNVPLSYTIKDDAVVLSDAHIPKPPIASSTGKTIVLKIERLDDNAFFIRDPKDNKVIWAMIREPKPHACSAPSPRP